MRYLRAGYAAYPQLFWLIVNDAHYAPDKLPVFLGDDRYEQDRPDRDPLDVRYFQRRPFWTWLLAGGSTNYGGRWWAVHPYSQTGNARHPARGTRTSRTPSHSPRLCGSWRNRDGAALEAIEALTTRPDGVTDGPA